MSSITAASDANGSVRHYLPFPGGLYRNEEADRHYANIRREDLVLAVRRIEPKPLPPRDMNRAYDTSIKERTHYHSERAADDVRRFGVLFVRPEDTRRKNLSELSRRNDDSF